MTAKRAIPLALIYAGLVAWALFACAPLIWMMLTSIKHPVDAFALPPRLVFDVTFDAYAQLWRDEGMGRYLLNSLIVATLATFIAVALAAPAGYALARIGGRWSAALLIIALLFRTMPRMAFVAPFYAIARATNLYDTHLILIVSLVAINQPFLVWMFHSFYRDMPRAIDEAAVMDGCSQAEAFWRVILPAGAPALVTGFLFAFLLSFHEFLLPATLAGTQAATAPVLISQFGADSIRNWTISAAGSASIALPIVVLVLFLRNSFVRGMAAGAPRPQR